jgi:hypothetical protein
LSQRVEISRNALAADAFVKCKVRFFIVLAIVWRGA